MVNLAENKCIRAEEKRILPVEVFLLPVQLQTEFQG